MLDNTENDLQNEVASAQRSTKPCQTTLRITSRMKSPAHTPASNNARQHWELPPEWSRQHTAQYQTMLDNTENYLQNEVTSTQPSTKQCQTTLRITSRMKSPAHSPAPNNARQHWELPPEWSRQHTAQHHWLNFSYPHALRTAVQAAAMTAQSPLIHSVSAVHLDKHTALTALQWVATVDVDDVVKALLSSQRQNCQGHGYEVRRDLGRWRLGPEKNRNTKKKQKLLER